MATEGVTRNRTALEPLETVSKPEPFAIGFEPGNRETAGKNRDRFIRTTSSLEPEPEPARWIGPAVLWNRPKNSR